MIKNATFIVIATLILSFATNISHASTKAVLGVLPFYGSEKILLFYKPFINYLKKSTGLSWDLRLHSNYDELVDNLCKGDISIAYIGPVPFARTHERCQTKPLLVVLNNKGMPYFSSVIFTANKQINSLEDLKGRRFAFGPRSSTAAYVMPRKLIQDSGITMDMLDIIYFKNLDDIIKAVLTGQADAGSVRDSIFEQFKKPSMRLIKAQGGIPHFVFSSSPKISKEIERAFVNALLPLKPLSKDSDRDIVSRWDPELRQGFMEPPKDYIENTRELLMLYKAFNEP